MNGNEDINAGEGEEDMAEGKTIIELPPLLNLPPINTEQIHPYAGERYLRLLVKLYDEVPLDQLSEEDFTDDERAKRKQYADEIIDWAKKCDRGSSEGALTVYPYSMVIFNCMTDMKALFKTAYERKLEKARREVEEKERQVRQEEEKKKRLAAFEAIDPPIKLAEKHLTGDEYQRFLDSIPGAIDAYLDGGKGCILNDWRLDTRAGDYSYWTSVIKERKEKEVRQKRAELEHSQFLTEINEAIKKFKSNLAKEKKPSFTYPPALAKYQPGGWCELERPTKQEVEKWAEQYIWERVPQPLKNFVSWELSWQVLALPDAKYEDLGVPCLTWCFRTLILVKAHLKLVETKFTKEFHGYEYAMKVEAEDLGSFYLGPVQGDHEEEFTTPIALLSMLAKGKLEENGIEVYEHGGSSTGFFIRGYDEAFTKIGERFRQFIIDVTKDKTLAEGLLARGMIDEVTAQLVEAKGNLPLPQLVGAGQTFSDNSDVMSALEAMGYKDKEIKEAMEATSLSPAIPLEEKVKVVLKFLDSNSL